jgi:hypothetical protein
VDADASLPAESGAISVHLCPETAVLLPGDPLQLTAMVEGTSDTAVYYSADWGDGGDGVLGSNGALKAPSQPGTYVIKAVSHADGTASASATITVVPKVRPVFSGTVSDPGNHQGVIYVEMFKSWPQAVTSISAPGAFKLRGISAAPGQQVTVRAFRDTLGVGQYVVGADPVGQATFTFNGGDQAGLSITLNDPPAPVLTAPSVVEIRPIDGTVIAGWQRIRNANDDEVPDHYRVYAGTTSNVGPGGNNVQVRTVRGGTSSNAIVDGLTNGQSFYFGVAPMARGVEGPLSVVGPFVIGTPPGGVKVSGQVDFAGVPATGPLYAVVYSENPKRAYVQAFAQPASPTLFEIPGVLDGSYQMVAIIDLDGDGEIGPLDPATFRYGQSSFFTVNGSDISGRNLVIPSSPALARAITSHERDEFGEHYQVALRVDANLELPIRAVAESGPGVVPPIDMGFDGESGSFRFDLPSGTSPPTVGAVYRFDVTYLSGVTCNLKAEITGLVAGFPTAVSPKGPATAQPSFTWTPPDPAPNISRWSLEVREATGGSDVWQTELPGTKTSITYNEDGRGESLVSGHTYRWTIRIFDENGNVASDTQSFSVP